MRLYCYDESLLMENFKAAGFKGEEIDELKRYFLHLHSTWITDISTGYGLEIYPTARKGNPNLADECYQCPP